MSLLDHPPRIPKWIFLLSDALLIAVAAFIAGRSTTPLSPTVIFAIVGCVATGALITAAAFVADYTRKQDEALDDRQRALESLARTVAISAEQISIAASGLHEIAELAQKNLRHAEKLPHQLHEKVAEFQALLATVNDAEREELEKELASLRTSESERLDSISDKIAKSAAEWAKLEAATQKHLAAATEALGRAQTQAAATLDHTLAAAVAALESKLTALAASAPSVALPPPPVHAEVAASTTAAPAETPTAAGAAHPPKRPRKPRREEPAEEPPAPPGAPDEKSGAEEFKAEEPPPVLAGNISEIAPVTPDTTEPFPRISPAVPPAAAEPVSPPPAETAPAEPKPARKRAPKKAAPEPDPAALSLDITETPRPPSAEVAERARSSDGATRLLVTAYIGIGNRLFIRGEGPGLTPEKGVPLQFVSIGKWRWETNAATAPVKFRLYKNDETGCAALGEQTLEPGDLQEVTATF